MNEEQQNNVIIQSIDRCMTSIDEYDLHINCLDNILEEYQDLPDEWPEELKQFKNQQSTWIATNVSDDDLDLVMKLHHRDIVKADRRMAFIEKNKTAMQLTALNKIQNNKVYTM